MHPEASLLVAPTDGDVALIDGWCVSLTRDGGRVPYHLSNDGGVSLDATAGGRDPGRDPWGEAS